MTEAKSPPKKDVQPLDWWPLIVALASAILAILFSPYLTDILIAAYATIIAFLIFGWLFTLKKYWPGSDPDPRKWWVRFFLIAVFLGSLVWITYASRPHFEITALNTLEEDSDTYEVTDMLIWNADEFDQYNTSGKFNFQITPLYYGQRKYGEVYAIIKGDQQDKEVKIWDYLTKDTVPFTFSLTLAEVFGLTKIETVESVNSSDKNTLIEDEPKIPTGHLTIQIVVRGISTFPWELKKITIRNAPWEQRSALVWRGDHYDVDLYVKNLGGKSDFTFRWYLANINKEVDSSPYITQNGATWIDSGYEPLGGVTLKHNDIFTTTISLDYPSDPGRYLVEVYPIKKQDYIEFLDPQYTWENMHIERPWWFNRTSDDLIFVVPAPETSTISIEEPFRAELERLKSQENIDLGKPLGAAEEITSDPSGLQGQRQFFENGVIYTYDDQVISIYGSVFDYFNVKFFDNDTIVFPISPIQKIYPGTDREALIMEFEPASENSPPSEIIISAKTRGWLEGWVKRVYYEKFDGPDGWLGFPISDLENYSNSQIQEFESGYIVYYLPEVDGEQKWDKEPVAFPYLTGLGNLNGIHAELPWQETGVSIHKGDHVTITQIGGEWTIDKNLDVWCHAEGMLFEKSSEWSIIPLAPIGAMIGRIGEDEANIFPIGRWSDFTAPADGMLYLSINDKNLQDNIGLISVQIIVEPNG